jgi:hypothetical protein
VDQHQEQRWIRWLDAGLTKISRRGRATGGKDECGNADPGIALAFGVFEGFIIAEIGAD